MVVVAWVVHIGMYIAITCGVGVVTDASVGVDAVVAVVVFIATDNIVCDCRSVIVFVGCVAVMGGSGCRDIGVDVVAGDDDVVCVSMCFVIATGVVVAALSVVMLSFVFNDTIWLLCCCWSHSLRLCCRCYLCRWRCCV